MKKFKLIYSLEFVNGLTEACEYIKKDNPRAARSFARRLPKRIKLLKDFPEMGRAATDARLEGVRILVIGNYRNNVEILVTTAIIHSITVTLPLAH